MNFSENKNFQEIEKIEVCECKIKKRTFVNNVELSRSLGQRELFLKVISLKIVYEKNFNTKNLCQQYQRSSIRLCHFRLFSFAISRANRSSEFCARLKFICVHFQSGDNYYVGYLPKNLFLTGSCSFTTVETKFKSILEEFWLPLENIPRSTIYYKAIVAPKIKKKSMKF
jgi:hypothetical protein